MSFACRPDARRARCETGLARLRMPADGEAGAVSGGQVVAEVREVTSERGEPGRQAAAVSCRQSRAAAAEVRGEGLLAR